MEDGYYLTLYVAVGEIAHLKPICTRHDQNIALWHKEKKKVELVRYWELERVTGLKQHRYSFYNIQHLKDVCNELLKEHSLTLNDMKGIYGCPELDTSCDYYKGIKPDMALHSIIHLYTGLLCDTHKFYNDRLLVLAVDGGPDGGIDDGTCKKYHYCGIYSDHGMCSEIFPVLSPGILWDYMARKFKLREGTLMALGSATTYTLMGNHDEVYEIYNDYLGGLKYYKEIDQLYDRIKQMTQADEGKYFTGYDHRFTLEENQISMVVKVIQQISINIMDYNIQKAIETYQIDPAHTYLSITGGYALNCSTNSFLIQKYRFKGFISPPCVNDSGLSLGMGLFIFHLYEKEFSFQLNNPYYGNEYIHNAMEEIEKFSEYIHSIETVKYEQIVDDIINEPIIWFDANSEIGPRALGHRSIIADPRFNSSKDRLNDVKMRQWWRPVAPIIMKEKIDDWFTWGMDSPYMLQTFKIKDDKRNDVPAICHLDYSARVQTMTEEDNPKLYMVLKKFYEKTGVPIICNTSLNDRGEPIIDSIPEAINFALRKRFSVIYINGMRVMLKNHLRYKESECLKRKFTFFKYHDDAEKQQLLKKFNPFSLDDEILKWRYELASLKKYDLTNENDVNKLKKIVKHFITMYN